MADYGKQDDGSGFGEKYSGVVTVGPPWRFAKDFYVPEGAWGGGRTTSVLRGTITSVLPDPVTSFDGVEVRTAPAEAIGEECTFFVPHPVLNHISGQGIDGYRYLAARTDRFGRIWPDFTFEQLFAKAGIDTAGLHVGDNDRLQTEIVALLNSVPPFRVSMWDGCMADAESQVPKGTRILCVFHRFLYYDFDKGRPTWFTREAKNKDGETYTARDVSFLMRAVGPAEHAGTLLRFTVNYTVKRMQFEETGNKPQWWSHPNAIIDNVMTRLGIQDINEFANSVPEELLLEAEDRKPANWLSPLEEALQEAAKTRVLTVTIPEKTLSFSHFEVADQTTMQQINGGPPSTTWAPRHIKDLSDAEIKAANAPVPDGAPSAAPPVPAAVYEDLAMNPEVARIKLNQLFHKEVIGDHGLDCDLFPNMNAITDRSWASMYLAPAWAVVGLDKTNPLVGVTETMLSQVKMLLTDHTYIAACQSDSAAAEVYGKGLIASTEEDDASSIGF